MKRQRGTRNKNSHSIFSGFLDIDSRLQTKEEISRYDVISDVRVILYWVFILFFITWPGDNYNGPFDVQNTEGNDVCTGEN